jgi:hypothetical protein
MDVGSDLGQHGRVLPVVMRAATLLAFSTG